MITIDNLQTRLELQGSIQQYIETLLGQGISPAMIEDALNKALLYVKDLAITEFLIALQQESAELQAQFKNEETEQQESEEVNGG